MGENGAGKSTLMKILAGVYTKDSGTILYSGQEVAFTNPREAQAAGIGIIHQELQLMNHLTVAQNIFIGREPRRAFGLLLDEDKLNRQAAALLEHMGLQLDPRTNMGSLTVAKQQMVEIAKSLSYNSRVLIMDEPTAALNDAEIDELFKMIRELKGRGVGIIYISHKVDELKQISDRVTVLRDGEYVGTVPTETTSIDTIISMMVGRTLTDVSRDEARTPRERGGARGEEPQLRRPREERQLLAQARGDSGLRRAHGRRADGGGARRFRRRPRPVGRSRRDGQKGLDQDAHGRRRRRHRLPVGGPEALRPRRRHGRRLERRHGQSDQVSSFGFFLRNREISRTAKSSSSCSTSGPLR